MTKNIPKINATHQTTDPGSLENPNRTNAKKTLAYHFQITVIKQKILKESMEENTLAIEK